MRGVVDPPLHAGRSTHLRGHIEVSDLGTFALGDQVSIGGGVAVDPPARAAVEVAGVTVPDSCAEHVIWMSAPSG